MVVCQILFLLGYSITGAAIGAALEDGIEATDKSPWHALAIVFAVMLWPLFVAGQLLEAPAQALLPSPGDSP